MSRNTTAPTAPQMIACRRWRPSSVRAAMAITTALSPERIMLVKSTSESPMKKSPFKNSGKPSLIPLGYGRYSTSFEACRPYTSFTIAENARQQRECHLSQGELIDHYCQKDDVQ